VIHNIVIIGIRAMAKEICSEDVALFHGFVKLCEKWHPSTSLAPLYGSS